MFLLLPVITYHLLCVYYYPRPLSRLGVRNFRDGLRRLWRPGVRMHAYYLCTNMLSVSVSSGTKLTKTKLLIRNWCDLIKLRWYLTFDLWRLKLTTATIGFYRPRTQFTYFLMFFFVPPGIITLNNFHSFDFMKRIFVKMFCAWFLFAAVRHVTWSQQKRIPRWSVLLHAETRSVQLPFFIRSFIHIRLMSHDRTHSVQWIC